jgi:hypothetical protein
MATEQVPPVPRFLDIAHLVFLEMLESYLEHAGPNEVNRFLVKTAIKTAETFPPVDFKSMEDLVEGIEELRNPIARIEGRAEYLGDGLFGLPRCPFADTYRTYKAQYRELSPKLTAIQDVFNRPGEVTSKLAVGHGAGVCPFCCAHQPMRAALAARISVGGKPIRLVQLACKGADGKRAFAEEFITKLERTHEQIDHVLDTFVCCYAITV